MALLYLVLPSNLMSGQPELALQDVGQDHALVGLLVEHLDVEKITGRVKVPHVLIHARPDIGIAHLDVNVGAHQFVAHRRRARHW